MAIDTDSMKGDWYKQEITFMIMKEQKAMRLKIRY
ncbi:UNVERIFIED_ORG: hypothetical protein ABRZ91_000857 [Heyndrickxia coagulans]